ncbi:hypothetical protein [Acinetobacter sp. WCHAc060042]|uniref:hypothetical protein n=1 Tax=Acinetobacter sp. WCHAc060042 TaxID=2213016 RepID=UPI000DA687A1|nr:hypothetical protein [Acinetobacter sp. WCHAc060042]
MEILKEFTDFAVNSGWCVDGESTQNGFLFYNAQTNDRWIGWQAATAQAVPEGFVLVNAESLALHAQSIRMFNNSKEVDDYYEIENHVCAIEAMIEAQEQSDV